MAVNDPMWTYGESKLFKSSGVTVVNGDEWVYGENIVYHEFVAGGDNSPTGNIHGPIFGPFGGVI